MVHEMRRRGIRIDIPAAERARDLLLSKRDAALAELSEKLGINVSMDELNRNAWRAAVFDQHKIAYLKTEKGNPSFTAGNSGWMHPHWLPRLIVKADKLHNYGETFLGTYILGHTINERVFAEIHPHRGDDGSGTRSLRFSYSSPPLQLMPKHDEELAPLIRGVFLPEENETWAECDVSQQEFRFIVHYAARHNLSKAADAVEKFRIDACGQLPDEGLLLHALRESGSDRGLLEERLVLAGKTAPSAQRLETIASEVFVDHRRERADFLEAIGRGHHNAGVGMQPSPIVKSVLRDDAHVGRDEIADPLEYLFGIKVGTIRLADREIVCADRALDSIGNAYADDEAVTPWPSRSAAGEESAVLGLDVERDEPDMPQVR
jgi:hypothetical protein